jgi:hypothetical protein
VTLLLAWLQREDDWTGYLWFIVFIVVPIAARLLRWLFVRLGLLREEEPEPEVEDPRARRARQRREQRRAESEGEELWRRLARGELPEPATPPAPPAPPARPAVPRPGPALETSLEVGERPRPLATLGEVVEPTEVAQVSLEAEAEPAPLETLSTAGARSAAAPPAAAREPTTFVLRRAELRRAVVWSEVLRPPVSMRA